jgi:hypothetical protein
MTEDAMVPNDSSRIGFLGANGFRAESVGGRVWFEEIERNALVFAKPVVVVL